MMKNSNTYIVFVYELSKLIENHIERIIYLEELAIRSGYSLWHMQKIFKSVTGISLGKYIRQRRLAKTVNLLKNSSKTIFDIALDFGFGSQSHFTYMFRKEFGITPYNFRKNPRFKLKIKKPLHIINN